MLNCSVEDFKGALDKHFEKIPDEPNVSGLVASGCTAEAFQLHPSPAPEDWRTLERTLGN